MTLNWQDKTTQYALGTVLYVEEPDALSYARVYGPVEDTKPFVKLALWNDERQNWVDTYHYGFDTIEECKQFVEQVFSS